MSQDVFSEGYWDDRYGRSERVWSGAVNPQIPGRTLSLRPGRALEVGCGEGADAIWLARMGWDVTALDVSRVGLDKAAAHAARAGVEIEWRQVDLTSWAGEPGAYDLVAAHYMYLDQPAMTTLYRQLGDAVAPGGTLLLVGHHPMDERHGDAVVDARRTPEEVAGWLDPDDWQSIDVSTVARAGHGGHGTMHDGIVQATRI